MTGVEILAMEEVVAEYAFNLKAYLICLAVAMIFCGVIGLVTSIPNNIWQGTLVGICVGLVAGAIIGQLPAWTTLPKEYETQYKVTISDEVSMNDFVSRYEIIDQEGKIYTVRERNE